jgi:predicted RNase H-like HicB family nuclease
MRVLSAGCAKKRCAMEVSDFVLQREGTVIPVRYQVVVAREGSDWVADVSDVPGGHTHSGKLDSLEKAVREVLELMEKLPEGDEVNLDLVWDHRKAS